MIIFIHFHKCGGTSIVSEFIKKVQPFEHHKNGNPVTKNNTLLDISSFDQQGFNKFALDNKHKFMALEFSFFKQGMGIPTSVKLITCLREPFSRFISNYKHDIDRSRPLSMINSGYQISDISNYCEHNFTYEGFPVNFNKDNYYTKFLNGITTYEDASIGLNHLEVAKRVLDRCDAILILEDSTTFELLKKYNINGIKHLNKAKIELDILKEFEEQFKKLNKFDYELYEYGKKLSKI